MPVSSNVKFQSTFFKGERKKKNPTTKLGTKIGSSLSLPNLFCLPHKSSELKKRPGDILPWAIEIQYPVSFGGFFWLKKVAGCRCFREISLCLGIIESKW